MRKLVKSFGDGRRPESNRHVLYKSFGGVFLKERSKEIEEGPKTMLTRSLLKESGLTDKDLERPVIAIASSEMVDQQQKG